MKTERRRGKTPDFRVYRGEEFQFYCEVKSIARDNWLDSQLQAAPKESIVGGVRNDPVYNRLTDDIHQAAKQFDAVNPEDKVPNVLVFVNHDSICDRQDLIGVLTGNFVTEDGSAHRVYAKFSEGRIKRDKSRIHLYCWLQHGQMRAYVFNRSHENHRRALCKLLCQGSKRI